MPSLLAHMMVLIEAADKLTENGLTEAEPFLFPNKHPMGDHPVALNVEGVGETISQLALLGANGPDLPGYRPFQVDPGVMVLALLGGAALASGIIYVTLKVGGERKDDDTADMAGYWGTMIGVGILLLVLASLIEFTDAAPERNFAMFASLLGMPCLAVAATLLFIYSKEDTKNWYRRWSLLAAALFLLVGLGLVVLGGGLALSGDERSAAVDSEFTITYLLSTFIGFGFALGVGLLTLYRGADEVSAVFRGSAALLCGLFLTILFPVLFSQVPNPGNSKWFDLLHKHRTGDFAVEMIKQAKQLKDTGKESEARPLMAFCLGYISHLAADTIVHPYINMFGGGGDIADYYDNFHRTTEVAQDAWLAKTFFNRDDVFDGESWTNYVSGTDDFKDKLDSLYNNAYKATYGEAPRAGFVSDSHHAFVNLAMDSAFDNELKSIRYPLIFLGGAFPFLFSGVLPGFAWAMPWSPYLRLTRTIEYESIEALNPVLRKTIVPNDLYSRLEEISSADFDEIKASIGEGGVAQLKEADELTTETVMGFLAPLSLDQKLAVLDALDSDKLRSGSLLSIGIAGALSLWDWISETFSPDHWDTHHIVLEPIWWSGMVANFFGGYFGSLKHNALSLEICIPFYYVCSVFQSAFSLDKMLYSMLTSMSVIPPKEPEDNYIHHTALAPPAPADNLGDFYRDVLLNKSIERTRALWKPAIAFYNGTGTDENTLRDEIKNWNIDTGYLIESTMTQGPNPGTDDDVIEVKYLHSWKAFGIG